DAAGWTPRLLRDVLVHELAHLAVHARHGSEVRPHGPEWQRLMTLAGRSTAATLHGDCGFHPGARPADASAAAAPARRWTYEHRCPVCQMVRYARRPVPQWRCRACTEIGLDGALEITRHTSRP